MTKRRRDVLVAIDDSVEMRQHILVEGQNHLTRVCVLRTVSLKEDLVYSYHFPTVRHMWCFFWCLLRLCRGQGRRVIRGQL